MPIAPPAVSTTGSIFTDLAIIIPLIALALVAMSLASSHLRAAATRAAQRVLAPLYGPPALQDEIAHVASKAEADASEPTEDVVAAQNEHFRQRELQMLEAEMFREE